MLTSVVCPTSRWTRVNRAGKCEEDVQKMHFIQVLVFSFLEESLH